MHIMKRIAAMITALMLLCGAALALEYPCEGVANTKSVRVRKKTSTSAGKIAALNKGDVVTILGETVKKNGDVWYHVETPKGKKGYVLSDYLSVPETDRITAAEESPDAVKMKVTIRAACSDYNGVGKNWTHYYEWNGLQAVDGVMTAFVAPDVELSVYARVREQDQKPDTGTEKTVYVPTAEEAQKGFTVTQTIRIAENGGKYRGNTATWTVTYTFKPVK